MRFFVAQSYGIPIKDPLGHAARTRKNICKRMASVIAMSPRRECARRRHLSKGGTKYLVFTSQAWQFPYAIVAHVLARVKIAPIVCPAPVPRDE